MDPPTVSLVGVPGVPMVQPGDDLPAMVVGLLSHAGLAPKASDVVVITSKIVSKAEGRTVDLRMLISIDAVSIAGTA